MKLNHKAVENLPKNDIFKGLPKHLKDPKNFESTEKVLREALKTDHKHRKPSAWVKCKSCQAKFGQKRALMKKMGFKSIEQYQAWKRIMDIIINKRGIDLS